jgi:hypothetical protein
MHHVFIHVVGAAHDHFAGLRAAIDSLPEHSHETLTFDQSQLDLVKSVEYTGKRLFRIWHYRPLYGWLVAEIDRVVANAGSGNVTLYLADEGVWAVILADYRRRRRNSRLHAVNVQHGFALVDEARFKWLRKLMNAASRFVFGFPAIGYGSLGGAGRDAFDLYLTYGDDTARFVRDRLGVDAIAAPHLIKHDLLSSYGKMVTKPEASRRALFAMNMRIAGSPILCDVPETLDALLPLATALDARGMQLIVRPHPGMDIDHEQQRFAAHPIARIAGIDAHCSLQESVAGASIVMSFLSTVLWEASLIGRLPVQIVCRCCREVDLGYPREILRLDDSLQTRLNSILEKRHTTLMRDIEQLEADEWSQVCSSLTRLVKSAETGERSLKKAMR